MTRYELACDKRITIAAVIFEVLMVVSCALLADSVIENVLKIPLLFAEPVSMVTAAVAVIVLQYLILAVEMIARYRDDQRGLTLPFVFLPGGMILRTLFMVILEACVIVTKLVVYFVSVMLEFVFQIARLDKKLGTAGLVDKVDHAFEPLEKIVNKIYNLLYFHKIRANSSVFTSVFNGSLSFWCINH